MLNQAQTNGTDISINMPKFKSHIVTQLLFFLKASRMYHKQTPVRQWNHNTNSIRIFFIQFLAEAQQRNQVTYDWGPGEPRINLFSVQSVIQLKLPTLRSALNYVFRKFDHPLRIEYLTFRRGILSNAFSMQFCIISLSFNYICQVICAYGIYVTKMS